jgi:hypothetical protein
VSTVNEINLALRTAAGHERAAHAAEATGAKVYEMKMASAGASAYGAFVLAIKAAPEYQGRRIDDAAIRRIYSSTKPRPWWDTHLKAVKVEGKPADREWGKRLIQWHLDPEAAKARRAAHALREATGRKRLKEQGDRATRGARHAPQAAAPAPGRAPSTAEMRVVANAAQSTALAGRELPQVEEDAGPKWQELLDELQRITLAARRITREHFGPVLDILRTTVTEVERYVP